MWQPGGADRAAPARKPPTSRSLVDALPPEALRAQIRDFIEFLRYNRNASTHTARAYESDLEQFLAIAASPAEAEAPGDRGCRLHARRDPRYLGTLYDRRIARVGRTASRRPCGPSGGICVGKG